MRQALAQALHNAGERQAFGKLLKDQPLMKNVLADLALESEAATALGLRLASAYDKDDESEQLLRRALTPAAKFWICKRGAHFAQEAMEAIGGNGYVEESILPRIYREMPLNSIWEGAGNVMCLDVLRALSRSPDVGEAVLTELDAARGSHAALDRFAASLATRMVPGATDEAGARRLTQDIALGVQASVLARAAPGLVFEAFVSSRLASPCNGGAFGMLPTDGPLDQLIERAMPAMDKTGPKARALPLPRHSSEQPLLEKLPESVGDLLRDQHGGLEKIAFNRVPIHTGNAAIQLQSDAFDDNQPMPMRYTADGAGASPPLQWSGVPEGAASLVLLVEDPDAPIPQPFVHAIVVGLPPRDGSMYEGELQRAGRSGRLKLGRNSFLQTTWLPPDPPRGHGVHRYAFQLFALKDSPAFGDSPGRDEVEEALRRSAIASGCLVGTYERTTTR
jgi:Raf kinase inhibitor-like YbhB/YbcL family protein